MLDFFKACAILFSAGRASRLRQGQGGHDRPAESTSPKEMRTRERLSFALFFSASAEATADASSLTFESDSRQRFRVVSSGFRVAILYPPPRRPSRLCS